MAIDLNSLSLEYWRLTQALARDNLQLQQITSLDHDSIFAALAYQLAMVNMDNSFTTTKVRDLILANLARNRDDNNNNHDTQHDFPRILEQAAGLFACRIRVYQGLEENQPFIEYGNTNDNEHHIVRLAKLNNHEFDSVVQVQAEGQQTQVNDDGRFSREIYQAQVSLLQRECSTFFQPEMPLHNQYSTTLKPQLAAMADEAKELTPLKVGLVGESSAGKSTFVNALLGVRLLPEGAGGICSAALVELERGDDTSGFTIEIEFITHEEWAGIRARYLDPAINKKEKWLKELVYLVHGGNPKKPATRNIRPELSRAMRDKRQIFSVNDVEELKKRLRPYTRIEQVETNKKNQMWPVVRRIHITGPFSRLPRGLVLVDMPGLGDPNQLRSHIMEKGLSQCNFVFYLAPCQNLLQLASQQQDLRRLISRIGVEKLLLVLTKMDNVHPKDLAEQYNITNSQDIEFARAIKPFLLSRSARSTLEMVMAPLILDSCPGQQAPAVNDNGPQGNNKDDDDSAEEDDDEDEDTRDLRRRIHDMKLIGTLEDDVRQMIKKYSDLIRIFPVSSITNEGKDDPAYWKKWIDSEHSGIPSICRQLHVISARYDIFAQRTRELGMILAHIEAMDNRGGENEEGVGRNHDVISNILNALKSNLQAHIGALRSDSNRINQVLDSFDCVARASHVANQGRWHQLTNHYFGNPSTFECILRGHGEFMTRSKVRPGLIDLNADILGGITGYAPLFTAFQSFFGAQATSHFQRIRETIRTAISKIHGVLSKLPHRQLLGMVDQMINQIEVSFEATRRNIADYGLRSQIYDQMRPIYRNMYTSSHDVERHVANTVYRNAIAWIQNTLKEALANAQNKLVSFVDETLAKHVQEALKHRPTGPLQANLRQTVANFVAHLRQRLDTLTADLKKEKEQELEQQRRECQQQQQQQQQQRPDPAVFNSDGVPYRFICPITCEIMRQPSIASDGGTYEYEAILRWIHSNPSRRSPLGLTAEPLQEQLTPNDALQQEIQQWLKDNNRKYDD